MAKELGVIDAARKLGVTLDAVYRQIYAGRCPARKGGHKWLIRAEWVEQRLKQREAHRGCS